MIWRIPTFNLKSSSFFIDTLIYKLIPLRHRQFERRFVGFVVVAVDFHRHGDGGALVVEPVGALAAGASGADGRRLGIAGNIGRVGAGHFAAGIDHFELAGGNVEILDVFLDAGVFVVVIEDHHLGRIFVGELVAVIGGSGGGEGQRELAVDGPGFAGAVNFGGRVGFGSSRAGGAGCRGCCRTAGGGILPGAGGAA